jgi:hypothetical protein
MSMKENRLREWRLSVLLSYQFAALIISGRDLNAMKSYPEGK